MMVMTVIWSFLVFDFIFIMTQGGPAFTSEVLSTMAYRKAFYELGVGYAAATALVISLFGLTAAFFYIRLQNREEAAPWARAPSGRAPGRRRRRRRGG